MSQSLVPFALAIAMIGCASNPPMTDAGHDAGPPPDSAVVFRDGGPDEDGGSTGTDAGPMGTDAGSTMDGGPTGTDAGPMGTDAGPMGTDAGPMGMDAGPMGTDAGTGGTCPALHVGDTIALDGTGDFAAFPMSQRLSAGGSVGSADQYAITWDRSYLYVALSSPVLADGLRPIHVYLEVRPSLGGATPANGKEYDGLTAVLPFSPTHLVAVRRTSVSMSAPYNGVYTPSGPWTTMPYELRDGVDVFAEGTSAVAFRVPWSQLGCASSIRLAAHVVNGMVTGNEWKDFVPMGSMPWNPMGGPGTYYEIDLTADPAVTGWVER